MNWETFGTMDENVSNCPDGSHPAVDSMDQPGVIMRVLAELPHNTILDEARLAHLLHVTPRTVRRMVGRFELPPPVSLGGKSVWMAGRVLDYIDSAAERRQREAERQARRFRESAKVS